MPGSAQPIPLSPPHRPVDRRLPENFGIVPLGERPILPVSEHRFRPGLEGIAGATALEGFDGYI